MARRFSASFPSARGPRRSESGPAPVPYDDPRVEEQPSRPVIVDCAPYTKGRRQHHVEDIEPALAEAERCDGFVWIGLREPGDGEFSEIAAKFDLPALAVEDAVSAHQRPKLELYPEILFAVIKPVRYVDSAEMVELAEIAVFLGRHFVITVRHGHSDIPARVRKELDADPALLAHGPAVVLHRILDMAVDEYADVIDDIGIDIDEIETQVFGGEHGDHSQRIYKLKREVLEFKRAVTPLTLPTQRLSETELRGVPEDSRPYFRDVYDHVLRASDAIEGYDSLLTNVLQADLAQVSVRQNQTAMQQNEDMRKISAWAAIALVPTAIAGIYGMNFDNMPELHTRYGYFVVLAAILLACSTERAVAAARVRSRRDAVSPRWRNPMITTEGASVVAESHERCMALAGHPGGIKRTLTGHFVQPHDPFSSHHRGVGQIRASGCGGTPRRGRPAASVQNLLPRHTNGRASSASAVW